eukprot:1881308-Amphidinium_carterae.3
MKGNAEHHVVTPNGNTHACATLMQSVWVDQSTLRDWFFLHIQTGLQDCSVCREHHVTVIRICASPESMNLVEDKASASGN